MVFPYHLLDKRAQKNKFIEEHLLWGIVGFGFDMNGLSKMDSIYLNECLSINFNVQFKTLDSYQFHFRPFFRSRTITLTTGESKQNDKEMAIHTMTLSMEKPWVLASAFIPLRSPPESEIFMFHLPNTIIISHFDSTR